MKKVSGTQRFSFSSCSNEDNRMIIADRYCGDLERGITSKQFPVFVQELTKGFLQSRFFTEREVMDQILLRMQVHFKSLNLFQINQYFF